MRSRRHRVVPPLSGTLAALALMVPGALPAAAQSPACQFILGFATLRELLGPEQVGACLADQRFAPNGDAQQPRGTGVPRRYPPDDRATTGPADGRQEHGSGLLGSRATIPSTHTARSLVVAPFVHVAHTLTTVPSIHMVPLTS